MKCLEDPSPSEVLVQLLSHRDPSNTGVVHSSQREMSENSQVSLVLAMQETGEVDSLLRADLQI